MEGMQLSLYELRSRFTKSEMLISGWRSGEIAANMEAMKVEPPKHSPQYRETEGGWSDSMLDKLEQQIGDLGTKMTDEKGDVDLRRLTGPEAVRVMHALGMASRRR